MDPKQLLQSLLNLQALEFDQTELGDTAEREMEKKIAELRLQIPLPVLNHYDRQRVRGKKGVAAVRNQTCTGCHVRVTKAIVLNLMHEDDLQVCENCGRYLYLPPATETVVPAESAKKFAAKPSKPSGLARAA